MAEKELGGQLKEESQVLAEELFRRFPEWAAFAEIHRGDAAWGLEPGSLTIEVPSLVAGRSHRLGIQHRGNTFEVFYSDGEPPGPAEGQYIFGRGGERVAAVSAVQLMADIVAERVVIARERFGRLLWLRPTSQLRFVRRDELTERRRRKLISVVSWRGTFDEVLRGTEGTR